VTLHSKNCFLTPEPFSLNGSSKLWHMQRRKGLTAILLSRAIYCPEQLPVVPPATDSPDFNKTLGGWGAANKPIMSVNSNY